MITAKQALLRREILQVKHLPPLSVTANRLLDAAVDPEVEVDLIAEIIAQDPALSARILGMANAAYFASIQPVHTVKEAIIRVLGLNMVKALALSVAMAGSFDTGKCKGFDLVAYWSKALGCATLSRLLALKMKPGVRPDPDALYLCGLMHNLGALVLAYVFPTPLSAVLMQLKLDPAQDVIALEQEYIGVNRNEAGEWLAFRWHLPEMVGHTIAGLNGEGYHGPFQDEVLIVRQTALWIDRYFTTGEPGLEDDERLCRLEGLDDAVLAEVEKRFLGQCEELQTVSRMLS